MSASGSSPQETDENKRPQGCETVLDLGFGGCKLQVQAPENGQYKDPRDLVGKNIGTSFVHLARQYFERLEAEKAAADAADARNNGDGTAVPPPAKLRTKIIELSGSVEAACALGVADGIVDLVGTSMPCLHSAQCRLDVSRLTPGLQSLAKPCAPLASPPLTRSLSQQLS